MSDSGLSAARPRRWPFYASLFVNVVLITVLAVGAWRIHNFRNAMTAGGMGGFWMPRQIEQALPEGPREKVRKIRESYTPKLKPLFETSSTARNAVRDAVDAEPFDADKLRAALKQMREADAAVAEATGEMVIEIATSLTPEERGRVRQAMRDQRPRRGGRGQGGPAWPGGPGEPGGPMPPPPPGPNPGDGPLPLPPPPGEEPPPPDDGPPPPAPD